MTTEDNNNDHLSKTKVVMHNTNEILQELNEGYQQAENSNSTGKKSEFGNESEFENNSVSEKSVDENGEPNKVNKDDKLPPLHAKILKYSENGSLESLKQLLNENEQNNDLVNVKDPDGYTPLHRAAYGNHVECARLLVERGADIHAETYESWQPLHCAAHWSQLEMAEFLISKGASVNAVSSGGNTALHLAASAPRTVSTMKLIQLLLYHPDYDITLRNQSNDTAFDMARRSGPFYKLWVGVMTVFDTEYPS